MRSEKELRECLERYQKKRSNASLHEIYLRYDEAVIILEWVLSEPEEVPLTKEEIRKLRALLVLKGE